jgi:hypothetical protein
MSEVEILEPIGRYGGANASVCWQGRYVYAGVGPRLLSFDRLPGQVSDVAVASGHAYVGTYDGLRIVDVSDPTQPREVASYRGWLSPSFTVADDRLYVAAGAAGLAIVRLPEPAPVERPRRRSPTPSPGRRPDPGGSPSAGCLDPRRSAACEIPEWARYERVGVARSAARRRG